LFVGYEATAMANLMKRLPELPAERALKVIAGRWKVIILHHLYGGPKRLSELRRLAPGASEKVLVQQLREMQEHGLISRAIFRRAPPRVEYAATAMGHSLEPIIMSLCQWGRHHATELDEADRLAECRVGLPARRATQMAATTTRQ
jgi:DNA-binding HxlR family transcriptional regulator